ncbi:MAG: YhbY family RNA-binding protein [Candidatus Pacearchaeota archaeon]
MQLISSIQVGKNGVSANLIETLKTHFKNHQNVKVVFLKNSVRDRKKIKKEAEKIVEELGKNYTYRILGFTIFIKKWRKNMR